MSKLNQIQQELLQINPAKYQELCDAYLHEDALENITSWGSVKGKEKTKKGIPDSYVLLENGYYIFIQYTTQEDDILNKLKKDVDECLDSDKTGIPIEKIVKIILCYNKDVNPTDLKEISEKCASNNCRFEKIDISKLSYGLLTKFPYLAKIFLNIEIDTGQILPPNKFIKEYQKNPFSTRLDNTFYFREKEINDLLSLLNHNELLIVYGKAGIGKTKFCLELMRRYTKVHRNYKSYCISNKGRNIYDDLKTYFQKEGNYLILVDDANKITQLNSILALLRENDIKREIKILLSVRDYALQDVLNTSLDYKKEKYEIKQFTKKEIKEILSSKDFNIKTPSYQDRICYISKGNPRLAIMAASIAIKSQSVSSLYDVTNLYDKYFSRIFNDLDYLDDEKIFKILGILSVFNTLDKENKNLIKTICEIFDISDNDLWEKIYELHKMEVVDLYNNQIVKISDQVLQTYFFYRVFIKNRILDFGLLLINFFDDYSNKMREQIVPTVNTFNYSFVKSQISLPLDNYISIIEKDENKLFRFFEIFWIFEQSRVFSIINKYVSSLEIIEEIDFDYNIEPREITDKYLNILKYFVNDNLNNYKISIDLIFKYLEKKPDLIPEVLKYIKEYILFDKDSHLNNYIYQTTFINFLFNKIIKSLFVNFYKKLLLKISIEFLDTYYDSTSMEDKRTFSIHKFYLLNIPEVKEFRKKIWLFLFSKFKDPQFGFLIIDIIKQYTQKIKFDSQEDICKNDSELLLPFLDNNLNTTDYKNCLIVHDYIDTLFKNKFIVRYCISSLEMVLF